jgi:thioesterase domain-containing protein
VELLKQERVGRHDNFFELGGHSLLAVQVISRLREALQVEVAIGDLFTRPVLSDFAHHVERAAELSSIAVAEGSGPAPLSFAQRRLWFLAQSENVSAAVALRVGTGDALSLFCVPGAGATAASFHELVLCLPEAWRIYGFQPQGLDGVSRPCPTVSAAADAYLAVINEIHPTGPVHLLGHSFGGWITFEMAKRLVQSGRVVGSLTMIDSQIPRREKDAARAYDEIDAILAWIGVIEEALERSLCISRADLEKHSQDGQRKFLHARLVAEGFLPRRSHPEELLGPLRTLAAALRCHYCPVEPYPGRAQLLLIDDRHLDQEGNQRRKERLVNGWKFWVPGLVCKTAPGNHMTVLKPPHVSNLASLVCDEASCGDIRTTASFLDRNLSARARQPGQLRSSVDDL